MVGMTGERNDCGLKTSEINMEVHVTLATLGKGGLGDCSLIVILAEHLGWE